MSDSSTSLFSVIIPAYNYAQYLPRALDSILQQRRDDCEIVVVDDGSTDDTAGVVRAYESRVNRRIRYAFQQNRGLAAARNHGVRLSTGRYLLFLDADDALFPDAMERFGSIIENGEAPDFVFGGFLMIAAEGSVKRYPAMKLSTDNDENFRRWLRSDLGKIQVGSGIVHRRVFERVLFPEGTAVWEDVVFNAHLLALYKVASIPELIVKKYQHADSLSCNVELIRRDGLKIVDLLFDPAILPARLMPIRAEFLSLVYLALFHFFYRTGHYQEARKLYPKAIRAYPRNLLKARHLTSLRKYLRILLKLVQEDPEYRMPPARA
jgi:glycosyltransferase involved in cell wall biosynthesis